jgi:hypothetical protein
MTDIAAAATVRLKGRSGTRLDRFGRGGKDASDFKIHFFVRAPLAERRVRPMEN